MKSSAQEKKRKGATRIADVAPDVLDALQSGQIEAATLTENLATDFAVLLSNILPDLSEAARTLDPKLGITRRMSAVATLIYAEYGASKLDFLTTHPSDLVRGWAAYLVAQSFEGSVAEGLKAIRSFADDRHFGVREWSWLAMRPHIVALPEDAISYLLDWTADPCDNLRRFAVEATRPRGVWSSHISLLKAEPQHGLDLLTPLSADRSRYVQDSVANWLNDAFKTSPDWVEALCEDWQSTNMPPETAYIIKRALRSKKA